MILLIKLILAHLLGDFIFQPASWVKSKEDNKLKSWHLYIHILIHSVLVMLLVWDITFLIPALIITISHGFIDITKIFFQGRAKRIWFFIDQTLHFAVIISVWYFIDQPVLDIQFTEANLVIVTAFVFITIPTSVIIKTLISQWTPNAGTINTDSLQNAGKFIGILERLMVLTFALTNNLEAIGFLITAKSVFRFGDLRDAKDLKLTEYVLIGTLLSFGIAIATSLIVNKILLTKGI